MRKRFRKMLAVLLVIVMIALMIPFGMFTVGATSFSPRYDAPSSSNGYYYSSNPFYKSGYGMPNCTCYAYGRAYELLGTEPSLSRGNAGYWWWYNKSNGIYSYGSTPKLGAIACWDRYDQDRGHVAVVEAIDGNSVTISESHYSGTYFDTRTINSNSSNYLTSMRFLGYIYIGDFEDEPVKNAWLNINQSEIVTGESINFSFGAENSNGDFTIGIDRYGTRVDTINVQGNNYNYTFYQDGDYSAYVTAHGGGTYSDSNRVYFRVYKPYLDLGKNFVATIRDVKVGKTAIVNDSGNIELSSPNDHIYEKWWFTHLEDGSYIIESLYNNNYITTLGIGNGSNIVTSQYNGSDSQRWYIYRSDESYELVPKSAIGQRMNLAGGETNDGTNIILWAEMNGSDHNQFDIEIEGYNYLWNLGTAFYATIDDVKVGKHFCVDKYENVELKSPTDNINERWWFIRQIDGTYTIESLFNNNYLTANGTNNASNVITSKYDGSDFQKWYVYPSNGKFEFAPKSSYKERLNIAGGETADGTNVILWEYMPNSDDIRFSINYEGNRYIYNHGAEFFASIRDGIASKPIKTINGNVELGTITNTYDDKWFFKRQNDGSYLIKSLSDRKYLSVLGGSTENGTNIITSNYTGGDEQKWFAYSYFDKFELVPKNAISSRMNLAGGKTEDKTNIILWQEMQGSAHNLFEITDKGKPIADTNLDGYVNIRDVTAIQRHLCEIEKFKEEQLAVADTNGDGEINIADATHLQMYLAEYGVVLGKQ